MPVHDPSFLEHEYKDEDEKNQIRSHAYVLRLFLFSTPLSCSTLSLSS